jgi:hypothetical protein
MEEPIQAAKNTVQSIGKQISEVKLPEINTETISQTASQGLSNVTSTIDSTKQSIANTLDQFSSQNVVNASQDFLNSNSIIAKFAFIIFVVIVFVFLINLGMNLIVYFTQLNRSPYLINGLISGNSNINVPQNPRNPDSITILRSNNRNSGLESTWSVWLLINSLNPKRQGASTPPTFSNIFNKGSADYIQSGDPRDTSGEKIGIGSVNNAPGVYVMDGNTNSIRIFMDTVSDNNSYLDITDIPLKKWFHLAIRIQNNVMDVYMNGVISGRKILNDVPKQNYDDVHVGYNGGFNGQLSNLVYYDHALGVFEINNIVMRGPNMTQSSAISSNLGYYTYLSTLWYGNKLH